MEKQKYETISLNINLISTDSAYTKLAPPIHYKVVPIPLFEWDTEHEQRLFTYSSLTGTPAKEACLTVRDKGRLEKDHTQMN